MKALLTFIFFGLSLTVMATDYGYLKDSDQPYFKNASMSGNNERERMDLTVKEINKLHGEISILKSEVAQLKKEIEALKGKK